MKNCPHSLKDHYIEAGVLRCQECERSSLLTTTEQELEAMYEMLPDTDLERHSRALSAVRAARRKLELRAIIRRA